uniref:Uncharacterized protein n=1 Tax=Chromera velia CCMP2878 TaxID=1169474 RepID=A0A0G4FB50_9ALVE|eukprot:Cvel_16092.t1-p1 / transcript=Cvel_16092.t1 / gene=Cvel_16092 / organism=Chromera_velia_CCMP2878 / gene_product=hypothetical protein / transcript_product=hypothetical protein / location=Cvel_scaffold1224:35439-36372(-) / protein_length=178 / sequence_SO=supercontig / SO=protein_coding / is_pseudo=false
MRIVGFLLLSLVSSVSGAIDVSEAVTDIAKQGGHVDHPEEGHVELPEEGHVDHPEEGHVVVPEEGHVDHPEEGHVVVPEEGHVDFPDKSVTEGHGNLRRLQRTEPKVAPIGPGASTRSCSCYCCTPDGATIHSCGPVKVFAGPVTVTAFCNTFASDTACSNAYASTCRNQGFSLIDSV